MGHYTIILKDGNNSVIGKETVDMPFFKALPHAVTELRHNESAYKVSVYENGDLLRCVLKSDICDNY